jgi:hypothetical protein
MFAGVVQQNAEKAYFHATRNEVTGLIYLNIRNSLLKIGMMMTISRPKEKFRA